MPIPSARPTANSVVNGSGSGRDVLSLALHQPAAGSTSDESAWQGAGALPLELRVASPGGGISGGALGGSTRGAVAGAASPSWSFWRTLCAEARASSTARSSPSSSGSRGGSSSSSTARSTSSSICASSRPKDSGGLILITLLLGPSVESSTEWQRMHAATIQSATCGAGSLLPLSITTSMPRKRPQPRTSPTQGACPPSLRSPLSRNAPTSAALACSPSSASTSSTASPAAHAALHPPPVLKYSMPLANACAMRCVVTTAPMGKPFPMPLPSVTISGRVSPAASKPQKEQPMRPKPVCTSSATQTAPTALMEAHTSPR
mmetsp:Transcript_41580/g.106380  ORF Transcript_41580/g.106380 Transcript_41580/m.106380 type:complete len:319 (+) Transcript_41580:2892-3848(+)